jgi:hypothetical protein
LTVASFDNAPQAQKQLVMLAGAGHLGFTDICVPGTTGLDELAIANGIDWPAYLDFRDECSAELTSEDAQPAIRSYTVEHYKRVLEGQTLSTDPGTCFASLIDEQR